MKHGKMTREQAADIVGSSAIEQLDGIGCDFTGRVQTDGDTTVEFSASIKCRNIDGDEVTLTAFYYQDVESVRDCEDLANLRWEVHGYEIY